MKEDSKSVLVKDLLKLLYEKACQQNLWGLVRHTAGMLGKRVEDLAKALTDLLVRQKQVGVLISRNFEELYCIFDFCFLLILYKYTNFISYLFAS